MNIVGFYHSAANTVNFSSHILLVIHGLGITPSTNCGRSFDGTVTRSPLSEEWTNKGISIIAITCTYDSVLSTQESCRLTLKYLYLPKVVCLVLALAPKFGVYLSNALGFFKLAMLLLVVLTGFTALAGNMKGLRPDNFSSFDGEGDACPLILENIQGRAANFALALIQVLYAYSGWENANFVC